jgi:hypothetical protein
MEVSEDAKEKTPQRTCVFCGDPANSREHVIPEWLSKRMAIRDLSFQPAHYSNVEGYEVRPPIKCATLKTRQVCKGCNNGWMSSLESWAQSRFGQYVEPHCAFDDLIDLKAIRAEANDLIRWMLKTAIMVELALPRGTMEKVVPSLYPVVRGTQTPSNFHIWASYIHAPRFDLQLLRGFPVWNGGVLEPYQMHNESMNFGLQMNHLALRLFRCPSASAGMKFHIRYPDGFRAAPLILTAKGSFHFQTATSTQHSSGSWRRWKCTQIRPIKSATESQTNHRQICVQRCLKMCRFVQSTRHPRG